MISCPCVSKGRPYCGSCHPNERALAELEARLTPGVCDEEQPSAEEEGADGQ